MVTHQNFSNLTLAFLLTLLVGCAGMNPPKPDYDKLPDQAPNPQSTVKRQTLTGVSKEFKQLAVDVEFLDSPAASADFANLLKERGYALRNLTTDKAFKAPKVLFSGRFISNGGGSKPINVPLGELLNAAYKANEGKSIFATNVVRQDSLITKSVSQALYDATTWRYLFNSGIASQGFAVGNILQSLGQATGAAGGFNKMIAGDPRGICAGKACETWYKINQSLELTVAVVEKDDQPKVYQIVKSASYEKMVIPQLLGDAVEDVFKILVMERVQ